MTRISVTIGVNSNVIPNNVVENVCLLCPDRTPINGVL